MGYIVDSNVLIDYVADRFENAQLKVLDTIFDEALIFSVVTKIEVLGYNGEPEEEKKMAQFVYYSQVINLDEAIVDKTIEIRKLMKIKMPDAIIASTALVYDHTLITRNTADFKRVNGLRLFNPYDAQ